MDGIETSRPIISVPKDECSVFSWLDTDGFFS